MRRRLHNRTFWKDHSCVSDSVCSPSNQNLESALATSIFSPLLCARTHFPCRLPVSRFIRWFGVSPISLSLAHSYTSVLVTVNIQYHSSQRLFFSSFGPRLFQRRLDCQCSQFYSVVILYNVSLKYTYTGNLCFIIT